MLKYVKIIKHLETWILHIEGHEGVWGKAFSVENDRHRELNFQWEEFHQTTWTEEWTSPNLYYRVDWDYNTRIRQEVLKVYKTGVNSHQGIYFGRIQNDSSHTVGKETTLGLLWSVSSQLGLGKSQRTFETGGKKWVPIFNQSTGRTYSLHPYPSTI